MLPNQNKILEYLFEEYQYDPTITLYHSDLTSGYWRNWVGPIKRLRMEPLPFQLVHKAQCIFLCVVLDLVRASFTLSRYCTIVQVHLLPPWALGKPFTTLSNLWASFTSLHMATVCNLEARELLPPPVGALLLRPRTFLVLGPSWGPTTNLSHPDTTSHCSGAQQPPAPIWNPPNCSSPNAMDDLQWGYFLQKPSLVLANIHKCHSSLRVSCLFSSLKKALISTYPSCSHTRKTAAH